MEAGDLPTDPHRPRNGSSHRVAHHVEDLGDGEVGFTLAFPL
jgi:hypothetical protein